MDNHNAEYEFPVILAPLRDLTKTNAQIQPTIDVFVCFATGQYAHLKDAAISVKPMVINLEDRHLLYISAFANTLSTTVFAPPIGI